MTDITTVKNKNNPKIIAAVGRILILGALCLGPMLIAVSKYLPTTQTNSPLFISATVVFFVMFLYYLCRADGQALISMLAVATGPISSSFGAEMVLGREVTMTPEHYSMFWICCLLAAPLIAYLANKYAANNP